MISMRGIAMSLAIHAVAATLISASAAIQPEAPVEDVAAIPVELILEMESAPVTPSAPVEEIAEAPVVETPEQKVVETPPEVVKPAPMEPLETASLQPPEILPKPEPKPEPELATPREMPVQVPTVVEEKPKPAEQPVAKEVKPEKPVQKIQKTEKPKEAKLKKSAKKTLNASKKKQVAALAAGKGSVGKQRSTDGRAAESNYNSKVLAKLRAAKKYPAAARGKGIEGTAVLSFTISSSGRLTSARVVKGAGHPLLDNAVLAMARNAAPFPAFPNSISKNQMTFSVPVQFKIN
jgi:protein TonB